MDLTRVLGSAGVGHHLLPGRRLRRHCRRRRNSVAALALSAAGVATAAVRHTYPCKDIEGESVTHILAKTSLGRVLDLDLTATSKPPSQQGVLDLALARMSKPPFQQGGLDHGLARIAEPFTSTRGGGATSYKVTFASQDPNTLRGNRLALYRSTAA